MKKIILYEKENDIKSMEKFDAQLNEDNVPHGIGSRVVDILVPEVFVCCSPGGVHVFLLFVCG